MTKVKITQTWYLISALSWNFKSIFYLNTLLDFKDRKKWWYCMAKICDQDFGCVACVSPDIRKITCCLDNPGRHNRLGCWQTFMLLFTEIRTLRKWKANQIKYFPVLGNVELWSWLWTIFVGQRVRQLRSTEK